MECDPIPVSAIHLLANGSYRVVLDKKDHKHVPWNGKVYNIAPGQLRVSGDGGTHGCIRPTGMVMDCLILPFST
jgi:hypothetical protein